MKNLPFYILVSILLSLILHASLLICLERMTFSVPAAMVPQSQKMTYIPVNVDLKEFTLEELTKRESEQEEIKEVLREKAAEGTVQDLTDEATRVMRDVFRNEDLIKPPPAPELRFEGVKVERAMLQPVLPQTIPSKVVATAPRPKVVEIKMSELPLDRQAMRRPTVPQLERVDVPVANVPSLLPHGDLTTETGVTYSTGLNLGARPKFGIPKSLEKSASLTEAPPPDIDPLNGLAPLPGGTSLPSLPDKITQMTDDTVKLPKVIALDEFVNVDVKVFRDRKGQGYFQVSIKANELSDSMGDIPKDTLLIIDHSGSISPNKLSQFKAASIEALSYLNPNDRFNVVSFTSRSHTLYDGLVPATEQNREKAVDYIRRLVRGGQTDVFGGIGPFVRKGNGNLDRPMNIFVLTDGQSTIDIHQMGDKAIHNHETDEFQRAMVGVNPGNVSIYPFSAGKDANRTLLDFLGYLNRGHNYHVDELKDFRARLVNYISSYSNLIVRDMRYLAEGKVSQTIYPRNLPHLYRHETLSIFGRFEPDDQELVLTLSGYDAKNQRRDLVFRRRYDECAEGPERMKQQWAAQKIMHLRAEITLCTDAKQRQAMEREYRRLANEYGVMISF
ncbi:MAG: VWA domain-containing protein [Lentisphaeria bacterium]|nr:VWA domain-containing protein [Victivallales bacterium]MBR6059535.1 VWA domain-containing protein [Victivallales bacterium]MCR4574935.1 VWA domain-containing protein [Lentisphaeria bacterium]